MEILLTAEQVAPMLNVNTQALYRLAREGYVPHIRIGERKIRFTETTLKRWAEEREQASVASEASALADAK